MRRIQENFFRTFALGPARGADYTVADQFARGRLPTSQPEELSRREGDQEILRGMSVAGRRAAMNVLPRIKNILGIKYEVSRWVGSELPTNRESKSFERRKLERPQPTRTQEH
jgi:hypothetical protein